MKSFRNNIGVGIAAIGALIVGGCTTDTPHNDDEMVGTAELAEVVSCPVDPSGINYSRELVITATSVVDDPCRTGWNSAVCVNKSHMNRWTFGYLMQQMAGPGVNVSTLILKWLESFETSSVVGAASLQPRSKIRTEIINPWRDSSGCPAVGTPVVDSSPCTLDLTKAPFRLLGIVNRMDLRSGSGSISSPYGGGSAGEARFVFGVTRMNGTPLDATVILEYKLPTNAWTPLTWAQKFHALGAPATAEQYNSALTTITEMFAAAGRASGSPNNSAISQVRTNERAFDSTANPVFELREQRLQCRPGTTCLNTEKLLLPATTVRTPSTSIDMTVTLRDYMNNNMNAILAGTHTIPASMLTGASRPINSGMNPFGSWAADAPLSSTPSPYSEGDVRRLFALSTCNGCHGGAETNTVDFHIRPRNANTQAVLSAFLTGPTTISEVLEGGMVTYDEPLRRKCEMQWLLNGNSSVVSTTSGRPH